MANDRVLEKFNFLVDKYHGYGNAIIATEDDFYDADKIPVLTECVILKSRVLRSPQFDELSPLRLLLDAALHDAQINLNFGERQALMRALENRIIVQEKMFPGSQD